MTNLRWPSQLGSFVGALFFALVFATVLASASRAQAARAIAENVGVSTSTERAGNETAIEAPVKDDGKKPSAEDDIENLFQREEQIAPVTNGPASSTKKIEIRDLKDLGKLSELKDVAVIQKRYLPRTKRFEVYIAPTMIVNDAFFQSYGANLRLGYNFRERYGIEILATQLWGSKRQVTEELQSLRSVNTTSLLMPQSYYGADFKWSPIYGKMTWLNRKIVPFDLYFSLGAGITQTNQSTSPATLHFGTGQTFALSKSFAFRWDFSWNTFSSTSASASSSSTKETNTYNNLLLTAGVSFFFPEATYR